MGRNALNTIPWYHPNYLPAPPLRFHTGKSLCNPLTPGNAAVPHSRAQRWPSSLAAEPFQLRGFLSVSRFSEDSSRQRRCINLSEYRFSLAWKKPFVKRFLNFSCFVSNPAEQNEVQSKLESARAVNHALQTIEEPLYPRMRKDKDWDKARTTSSVPAPLQ